MKMLFFQRKKARIFQQPQVLLFCNACQLLRNVRNAPLWLLFHLSWGS